MTDAYPSDLTVTFWACAAREEDPSKAEAEVELARARIVTVGDLSAIRVRLEVDETEIAPVHVGQSGWITAAAYGERRFRGRVVRVATSLGKRTFAPKIQRNETIRRFSKCCWSSTEKSRCRPACAWTLSSRPEARQPCHNRGCAPARQVSRLARADGGDAHAGALHRPGVDLRAQVRRHPPARVQARRRRAPVLAQPAAAERCPARRRGDRGAAGATT